MIFEHSNAIRIDKMIKNFKKLVISFKRLLSHVVWISLSNQNQHKKSEISNAINSNTRECS